MDSTLNMESCHQHEEFLAEAIRLSIDNITNGGGPFGAVIVKQGRVIATGTNRVTANNDPTAHAEVMAIRAACKALGTFELDGCTIYSSCEPCPMCLSAIYWAGISELYYACDKADAAAIGFDDKFIYDELERPVSQRRVHYTQMMREQAIEAFRKWHNTTNKTEY